MDSAHKKLCLQVNRRSSLALFILILVTYSTEISFTIGGVIMLAVSCSCIPKQTTHIENQIITLRSMIQDLRMEIVANELEMDRQH